MRSMSLFIKVLWRSTIPGEIFCTRRGGYAVVNLMRILASRLNAGAAVVKKLKGAKKRPQVLVQASGVVLSTEGGALRRILKAY
jgi:hypothetical protein